MTAKREQFANNARTTLDGSLTDVATSVTVDSASDFPTDGNFRILIDSELMLVTSVAAAVFTVERAAEGTTGVAHDDGGLVTQLVTDEGLRQVISDDLLYANQKPLYHSITNEGGTIIQAADVTWIDQGSSTVIDKHDTLYFEWPSDTGANQHRGIVEAVPSGGTPYTCTVGFRPFLVNDGDGTDGYPQISLGFRDSGTGRMTMLSYHYREGANALEVVRMTDTTTYSSSPAPLFGITSAADMWMRIIDNGTNILFYASIDGVNWVYVDGESRTAWTADPDQFYFGNNPEGTGVEGSSCVLFHYSVAEAVL